MRKWMLGVWVLMVLALCACAQMNEEGDLSLQEMGNEYPVSLTVKDVTSTGLTLICENTGEGIRGELTTGSPYILQERVGNTWSNCPTVIENYGWTMEAWIVQEGTTEWKVDWNWLHGELEPGRYRIGKSFFDYVQAGEQEEFTVYAEFDIK